MQMLVVNPRRKRRRGKKRHMSALQRQFFGGGRKSRRRRRSVALSTGSKHVRRSRRRSHRRMSLGGRGMRLGSFNPKSFINDTLLPAGIGAGGALALDAALTFAAPYIPASLNTGIARTGIKLAGAIGIGMIAGMAMGKRFGEQAAAGAVTVVLYDFLKPYAAQVVPGISGYDMGWVSPSMQIGAYVGGVDVSRRLGSYVGDAAYDGRMGEREEDYYAYQITP